MAQDDKDLERMIQTRLLRLNAAGHGIVLGLLLGTAVFVATMWLVIKGGRSLGPICRC